MYISVNNISKAPVNNGNTINKIDDVIPIDLDICW